MARRDPGKVALAAVIARQTLLVVRDYVVQLEQKESQKSVEQTRNNKEWHSEPQIDGHGTVETSLTPVLQLQTTPKH